MQLSSEFAGIVSNDQSNLIRDDTFPLVTEAFTWEHGILLGSLVSTQVRSTSPQQLTPLESSK